jgi:hypothetical protein
MTGSLKHFKKEHLLSCLFKKHRRSHSATLRSTLSKQQLKYLFPYIFFFLLVNSLNFDHLCCLEENVNFVCLVVFVSFYFCEMNVWEVKFDILFFVVKSEFINEMQLSVVNI